MSIVYILLGVITVGVIGYGVHNYLRSLTLDEREEELDKYSLHLDERANLTAANEQQAIRYRDMFQKEYEKIVSTDYYTADYIVTDADIMKYTTERSMITNAKNRLAMTIAHDIAKRFEPVESQTEEGRRKFTYKFKIVK